MPAINLNSPYSQNFDSLANSGTNPWNDDSTISGWYSNRTSYTAGTGSSNTGSLYSFGSTGSTERALGSVASGSTNTIYYGARFVNNTSNTINGLNISYTGEQWRNAGNTSSQILDFQYQIGATSLTSGNWLDFNALDFTSPIATATPGALNGNAAGNRTALSSTLGGLNVAPGQEIWLRWQDVDNSGADHGLGIDDFSISTVDAPPPPPPPAVRIHDIQGAAHISPLNGQTVSNVPGIVTATRSNGFYLQDPNPDTNDATSEGIFVFTSSAPIVSIGDSVQVSGTVSEFRPGGSGGINNLTTTQITSSSIVTLSSGNALPTATILGNGGRAIPTQVISNDAANGNVENAGTLFDPAQDGIDFYESVEGMRVQVNNAVAVGPTSDNGEIPVLADNGANASLRTARGGIVIQPDDFNPERIIIDDAIITSEPQVNVGDTFNGATIGVIDYSFGNFKLLNTQPLPSVTSGNLQREVTNLTPSANQLTVATFNVENLDPGDGATKFNNLANRIVNNLKSPDIINLEEIQDNNGPTNDSVVDASQTFQTLINAIASAGGPTYEFRQINPVDDTNGGEPGGNIRVGFLFNPGRVQFVDRPGGTSTSSTTVNNVGGAPEPSFSPGLIDPTNSAFNNSRKPLVGEFIFNGRTVFVVGNHFNSKGGDQPLFGANQPPALSSETQRNQQATVVRDFVQSILAIDPNANVVVAGDLNDFEFSNPVNNLESAGLTTLIETLPQNERYSYVFDGNSQTLDHILVSSNLRTNLDGFDAVHINSEFAVQDSDHDPVVARFNLPASVINGTSGRDTLVGTSDNDRIIGGAGADTLSGGPRSDQFVYTNIRDRGDTINDFQVANDKLVFTELLDSLVPGGYSGTDAIADGYVRVVQGSSSNNSGVEIDSDASAGGDIFRSFITVNVAGTGNLNSPSNFVF